ncbi:uncharacterized protein [Misgurnus anguillicaudatus]|uniref:uncharacterized protein isoform X1 n=1 Tax=Misgurnus anguillicaudatus TaxID=75329 RepID=UPI003CCF95A0
MEKMNGVIFFCLCLWSLSGVFGSQFVSVMEGDSVVLSFSLTEKQIKDGIYWKFGPNKTPIAEMINYRTTIHDDRPDGTFKNRLLINHETGTLTITNTRTPHTGLYILTDSQDEPLNIFNITVTRLPVPVITRDPTQCSSSSSSSSNCSLLCSVFNVRDVSLSWYKGNSLLSSTSWSDLNTNNISLHLEVDYQDTNKYSCVVNNTNTKQIQHLNITHLCQTCSVKEVLYCCRSFIEVVIGLVVSVLVGVAAVGFVVYDIRFRRDEEKKMRSDKLH